LASQPSILWRCNGDINVYIGTECKYGSLPTNGDVFMGVSPMNMVAEPATNVIIDD